MTETQICNGCGLVKEITEFSWAVKDVRRERKCKSCRWARQKIKKSERDKSELNEIRRAWRDENKDHLHDYRQRPDQKEQIAKRSKKWEKENPESRVLRSAKYRAKRKNIPFNLEIEDIIIPEFCPVLGLKLEKGNERKNWNSPSLDRKIPALGYVKGNVRVISMRANTLKNNATSEELEKILEDVRRIEQEFGSKGESGLVEVE